MIDSIRRPCLRQATLPTTIERKYCPSSTRPSTDYENQGPVYDIRQEIKPLYKQFQPPYAFRTSKARRKSGSVPLRYQNPSGELARLSGLDMIWERHLADETTLKQQRSHRCKSSAKTLRSIRFRHLVDYTHQRSGRDRRPVQILHLGIAPPMQHAAHVSATSKATGPMTAFDPTILLPSLTALVESPFGAPTHVHYVCFVLNSTFNLQLFVPSSLGPTSLQMG